MGRLDNSGGSSVKREIKFIDVTGKTPTELEDHYNDNFGKKGWRIIQILEYNSKLWVVAEREV